MSLQIGVAASEAVHDVLVEVLIDGELDHARDPSPGAGQKFLLADPARHARRFHFPADCGSLLIATAEIGVERGGVARYRLMTA